MENTNLTEKRDEEIDVARATEIARDFVRANVGNLNLHQFRIESVKQNGDHTIYIVTCSVIPDVGKEREYYLIRVDVKSGRLVPPIGRGKKIDGEFRLEEMDIDPKWVT